jgi:hypothetical protein
MQEPSLCLELPTMAFLPSSKANRAIPLRIE